MNLNITLTHRVTSPELLAAVNRYGALIMSTIEQVQATADQALSAVRAANDKADAVISTLTSVRDELAALVAAGTPSAEALDGVVATLNVAIDEANAQSAQNAAAIG